MRKKLFKGLGSVVLVAIMLTMPVLAFARAPEDYPLTCPRCGNTSGSYSIMSGYMFCHRTTCGGCGTSYLQRHWDNNKPYNVCDKCGGDCDVR